MGSRTSSLFIPYDRYFNNTPLGCQASGFVNNTVFKRYYPTQLVYQPLLVNVVYPDKVYEGEAVTFNCSVNYWGLGTIWFVNRVASTNNDVIQQGVTTQAGQISSLFIPYKPAFNNTEIECLASGFVGDGLVNRRFNSTTLVYLPALPSNGSSTLLPSVVPVSITVTEPSSSSDSVEPTLTGSRPALTTITITLTGSCPTPTPLSVPPGTEPTDAIGAAGSLHTGNSFMVYLVITLAGAALTLVPAFMAF